MKTPKLDIAINEALKEVDLLNESIDRMNNNIRLAEESLNTNNPSLKYMTFQYPLPIELINEQEHKGALVWAMCPHSKKFKIYLEKKIYKTVDSKKKEIRKLYYDKPLLESSLQDRVKYYPFLKSFVEHFTNYRKKTDLIIS